MPGAPHRIAHDQPLGERATVVGAGGSDGEYLLASTGEQHGLSIGVTQERSAFTQLGYENALFQIRSRKLCG